MESGEIKDDQITASSSRPADLPQYGRLHNGKYWCAAKKSENEYFQVDLGQVCKISKIFCAFCVNKLFCVCYGLLYRMNSLRGARETRTRAITSSSIWKLL